MKKVLVFSVSLNVVMFIAIASGGVYCYMAFKAMEQKIIYAQEFAKTEISNLKESFAKGKEQLYNEYQEIKENTILKNAEEMQSNLKFANDLLDLIQNSGGVIINENIAWKDKKVSASEWSGGARAEAKLLALAYDGQEILSRLSSTKFGDDWKIMLGNKKTIRLYDWLSNSDLVQEIELNKPIHTIDFDGA